MEARAVLKYARISPRKVKIVLDLIRNKPANVAMGILKNTPKSASELLEKLLASAIANAENNHDMDKKNLYVAECYVCPGPIMKRIMPTIPVHAKHNNRMRQSCFESFSARRRSIARRHWDSHT